MSMRHIARRKKWLLDSSSSDSSSSEVFVRDVARGRKRLLDSSSSDSSSLEDSVPDRTYQVLPDLPVGIYFGISTLHMTARTLLLDDSQIAMAGCLEHMKELGSTPLDVRIAHLLSIAEKQHARFQAHGAALTLQYDYKGTCKFSTAYIKKHPTMCENNATKGPALTAECAKCRKVLTVNYTDLDTPFSNMHRHSANYCSTRYNKATMTSTADYPQGKMHNVLPAGSAFGAGHSRDGSSSAFPWIHLGAACLNANRHSRLPLLDLGTW